MSFSKVSSHISFTHTSLVLVLCIFKAFFKLTFELTIIHLHLVSISVYYHFATLYGVNVLKAFTAQLYIYNMIIIKLLN